MDPFDDAQQPRCPGCVTLMRDVDGGWECAPCNQVLHPTGPIRLPRFDGQSIHGG